MKTKIFLLMLWGVSNPQRAEAQFLSTLFSQKEADLKSQATQLALIGTYVHAVEQGYRIAEQGLHRVEEIKQGDLGLHTVFYSSLKTVRRNLVSGDVLNEIQSDGRRIDALTEALLAFGSGQGDEDGVMRPFAWGCQEEATAQLDLLIGVLTTGRWTLTDAERASAVDRIHRTIQAIRTSLQVLRAQEQGLARSHRHETGDIRSLQKLK